MEQVTKDLIATGDYLDEYGWCQGNFRKQDGRVCLDGALINAIGAEPGMYTMIAEENVTRYYSARNRLAEAIGELPGLGGTQLGSEIVIWEFNDDANATVEDIKLILKQAIALDSSG